MTNTDSHNSPSSGPAHRLHRAHVMDALYSEADVLIDESLTVDDHGCGHFAPVVFLSVAGEIVRVLLPSSTPSEGEARIEAELVPLSSGTARVRARGRS